MKNRKYSPNNTKNIDLFYFQKHNISSKGKKKIKKKIQFQYHQTFLQIPLQ